MRVWLVWLVLKGQVKYNNYHYCKWLNKVKTEKLHACIVYTTIMQDEDYLDLRKQARRSLAQDQLFLFCPSYTIILLLRQSLFFASIIQRITNIMLILLFTGTCSPGFLNVQPCDIVFPPFYSEKNKLVVFGRIVSMCCIR